MKRRFPFAAAVSVLGAMVCIAVLAFLAGCGGGGSGSAGAQPQFGRINLRITDSPVTSAKGVVVQFTGLEIKPVADDEAADVDDPISFSAPLNATVSAGQTTTVEFLAAP